MNKLYFLFCVGIISIQSLSAQTIYEEYLFKQTAGPSLVTNDGVSYSAFTGGFHKPQFNNLDVNLDGILDLVIFDKEDDISLVFVGNGDSTNPQFVYAPKYEPLIPKCWAWVRIADFNGDGLPDIFTSNHIGGVMVYKNVSSKGQLAFKLYNDDLMYYDIEIKYFTPLFVAPSDQPVIDDIDGDGDLDILSFDSGGGNITYYQNQSIEAYGHKDSFNYLVPTFCWGRFQEADTSNAIVFAPTCYLYKKRRHAGSNMITIDYDNDGDKDLLLSDVSYKTVLLLENGWNPNSSNGHNRDTMIKAHSNFPSNTKSVNIDLFPSISYCDINFDGARDLVFAPASHEENFNVLNTWAYENIGTEKRPVFDFVRDDFIQQHTIDNGEFSKPALFDYDADGDLDLFLATPTPYTNFEYDKAFYRIMHYENVGDSTEAKFELVDEDFLDISKQEFPMVIPAFGDANNDGTIDLLLGLENGRIAYYSNSNTPDKMADFKFSTRSFMSIKLSGHAAPCVYDINHDGDNDLLLGSLNGKLAYYEWNTGNDSVDLITDKFLDINVGHPTLGIGFSVPRMGDFDGDGNDEILVANSLGNIKYYRDFKFNETGKFETPVFYNELKGFPEDKDFGANLSIEVADLNNDSFADIIIGNKRGGLLFAEGFKKIYDGIVDVPSLKSINLYPNPANEQVVLSWSANNEAAQVSLINLAGQELLSKEMRSGNVINLADFDKGIYLLMFRFNDGSIAAKKLVVE